MREIYDIITKETIDFDELGITKQSREMGIDHTYINHVLSGQTLHAYGRYILPINKDKIFTLVELDTGKEYDCITNKSIFLYFGLPIIENEIKYMYELFKKRQRFASICGRVFYLKGNGAPKITTTGIKNFSETIKNKRKQNKIRKRIYSNLLGRIQSALLSKNVKKLNHTEELIGCKILFFIGYIEALFTKEMSWENYGDNGWHIDHINPCINFDLTNIEEQKKCFHYTNLRPLWATTEIAMKYGEDNTYIGNLNRKRY